MTVKEDLLCAYCGARDSITRDHVPPRNLYPKPASGVVVTVPCCLACQRMWEKDDEYLRAAVVTTVNVESVAQSQQSIDALFRSLERPQQRGFTLSLVKRAVEVDVQSESGILVGKVPVLEIDPGRIGRVLARIVRGLFFHETGARLAPNCEVTVKLRQFGLADLLAKIGDVTFPPFSHLGNGVFSYSYITLPESPLATFWLAAFYDRLPFLALTRPSPSTAEDMSPNPSLQRTPPG